MNRYDLGCLAVAITSYLASEHFAGLAPTTQRTRRSLLRTVFAHVQRLSATEISGAPPEISEARNGIPSETSARSAPWRPAHQRRNWRTA
jgi:hypothetical protein